MKEFIKFYTSQIAVWIFVVFLMGVAGYLPERFYIISIANILLVSPFLFSEKTMTCSSYVKSIFSKLGLTKFSISIDITLIVATLAVCINATIGCFKGEFDVEDLMYFPFLMLFAHLFHKNFIRYLVYKLNAEALIVGLMSTLLTWIIREVHHDYFYLLENFYSYFIDMGLKAFLVGSFIFALNSIFKFKEETV